MALSYKQIFIDDSEFVHLADMVEQNARKIQRLKEIQRANKIFSESSIESEPTLKRKEPERPSDSQQQQQQQSEVKKHYVFYFNDLRGYDFLTQIQREGLKKLVKQHVELCPRYHRNIPIRDGEPNQFRLPYDELTTHGKLAHELQLLPCRKHCFCIACLLEKEKFRSPGEDSIFTFPPKPGLEDSWVFTPPPRLVYKDPQGNIRYECGEYDRFHGEIYFGHVMVSSEKDLAAYCANHCLPYQRLAYSSIHEMDNNKKFNPLFFK